MVEIWAVTCGEFGSDGMHGGLIGILVVIELLRVRKDFFLGRKHLVQYRHRPIPNSACHLVPSGR